MAEQTAAARRSAAKPAPVQARSMNGPGKARLADVEQSLNTGPATQRVRQFAAQAGGVRPNRTGLPDQLKQGVESLSGLAMDHVRVHYNSSKPAQLNAHAYAQGADIHLGPGQDQHLPHEAWHLVQQAQGRVRPTMQMKAGVAVNDEASLEHEATVMGERALSAPVQRASAPPAAPSLEPLGAPVQRLKRRSGKKVYPSQLTIKQLRTIGELLLADTSLGAGAVVAGFTLEKGDRDKILYTYRHKVPDTTVKKRKVDDLVAPEQDDEDEDSDFELNSEDEAEVYLMTDGRYHAGLDTIKLDKEGRERELKPWNELSLQGTMGEYYARRSLAGQGETTGDLNRMQHNFPGLDNISDHPEFPFEQTKLHLSESTANTKTYLDHLKKAPQYAIKAIKGMKRHKKKFKGLQDEKGFEDHDLLSKVIDGLDDLDGYGDDEIDGSDVHDLVTDGMRFSVPSDIYEKLPKSDRPRFLNLGKPVPHFRGLMEKLSDDFTVRTPRRKGGEDPEYVPESPRGKSKSIPKKKSTKKKNSPSRSNNNNNNNSSDSSDDDSDGEGESPEMLQGFHQSVQELAKDHGVLDDFTVGHADGRDDNCSIISIFEAAGQRLTRTRARELRQRLVQHHGVDPGGQLELTDPHVATAILGLLRTEVGQYRIRIIVGDGDSYGLLPPIGDAGPIIYLFHTLHHFSPAWPKRRKK